MLQAVDTRQMRLKDMLLGEKLRLWNELRVELFEKLGVDLNHRYDISQDIVDRSFLCILDDTGLAIADPRRGQLRQMEEAFTKLENWSYGICEDCCKEIDEGLLKATPYAICCDKCRQQRESPETPTAQYQSFPQSITGVFDPQLRR